MGTTFSECPTLDRNVVFCPYIPGKNVPIHGIPCISTATGEDMSTSVFDFYLFQKGNYFPIKQTSTDLFLYVTPRVV